MPRQILFFPTLRYPIQDAKSVRWSRVNLELGQPVALFPSSADYTNEADSRTIEIVIYDGWTKQKLI